MASFSDYIQQAKDNAEMLQHLASTKPDRFDWQITLAFYSALHLMNAHCAQTSHWNYPTHTDMESALNPYAGTPSSLPQHIFTAYKKLRNLSRTARYLCDDKGDANGPACFSNHSDLLKAIGYLDAICGYVDKKHNFKFDVSLTTIHFAKNPGKMPWLYYKVAE